MTYYHPTPGMVHPISPTYEQLDFDQNQYTQMGAYGTFHPYAQSPHPQSYRSPPFRRSSNQPIMIQPRPGGEGGMLVDNQWKATVNVLRDEPIRLTDGTVTQLRYHNGNYAKLAIILLFFALCPFGLCFFAFLPFCLTKKCKWMKDIEHIDPTTNNTVGAFYRGTYDAPQRIVFYREPDRPQIDEEERNSPQHTRSPKRNVEVRYNTQGSRTSHQSRNGTNRNRHSNARRSPGVRFSSRDNGNDDDRVVLTQPIQQQIIFKDKPVELPDGQMTETRKRIGACNLQCAFITLFIGFLLSPFMFIFSLICFCLPFLKDVEHIHPTTREIVGVYYRCK